MANVKISGLAAVSTIAGTEVLPVVQGGATSSVTPALLATYVRGTITAGVGTVTSVAFAVATTVGFTISGSPISTSGTFTLSGNLSTTALNSGTSATSSTFFRGDGTWATPVAGAASTITVGTTTVAAGTSGRVLINNSGVLGENTTTGSGGVVFSNSPGFVTPNLGTPSAAVLTNATGLPITTGTTGILTTGRGGTNTSTASTGTGGVVLSVSPALTTPDLGTPSAVVLTSGTGLPFTTGVTGTVTTGRGGTNTTSASTGSGGVVLAVSPALTTPNLGTPTALVLTSATGLPLTTGVTGVLTTGNGGTNTTTASTGSGGVVLATSPTLVTPNLGTPSAVVLTSGTGLPLTTGITGTLTTGNGGTNTTSASTGSGGVVLATNAALVTPTLGVASATSMTADAFLVTTNWAVATGTIAKTLVSADNGKHFKFTTSASVTLTLNTGLPVGFWCAASQGSSGQITIAGTATTTSVNGKKSSGLGAKMMVENWATTDTYLISGSITT